MEGLIISKIQLEQFSPTSRLQFPQVIGLLGSTSWQESEHLPSLPLFAPLSHCSAHSIIPFPHWVAQRRSVRSRGQFKQVSPRSTFLFPQVRGVLGSTSWQESEHLPSFPLFAPLSHSSESSLIPFPHWVTQASVKSSEQFKQVSPKSRTPFPQVFG